MQQVQAKIPLLAALPVRLQDDKSSLEITQYDGHFSNIVLNLLACLHWHMKNMFSKRLGMPALMRLKRNNVHTPMLMVIC